MSFFTDYEVGTQYVTYFLWISEKMGKPEGSLVV